MCHATSAPISRRTLRFFTANTAFDVDKARTLLGFRPQYNLAAGLRETHRLLSGAEPWRLSYDDDRGVAI